MSSASGSAGGSRTQIARVALELPGIRDAVSFKAEGFRCQAEPRLQLQNPSL